MSKILIVDPSLLDRKRIRGILEAAGHQVEETDSPTQAAAYLANVPKGTIKLVVSELAFPDHPDGLDFVRQVKTRHLTAMVPVLVVSGLSSKEDTFAAIQAGASNMIGKPFGGDLLLRRVTETLAEASAGLQGENDSLSWRTADYIYRELKRCERTGHPLSILIARIRPHDAHTVSQVLAGLQKLMRASDILARLGDDRIILILPDTDVPGTQVVQGRVERLVQALTVETEERPGLTVWVKVGAATYPAEAADGEALLLLAGERCVE